MGTSPERHGVKTCRKFPSSPFELTVNGVHDLTVNSSCTTLFDLGVIEAEKFVNPSNQFRPGFPHSEYELVAANLETNARVGFTKEQWAGKALRSPLSHPEATRVTVT